MTSTRCLRVSTISQAPTSKRTVLQPSRGRLPVRRHRSKQTVMLRGLSRSSHCPFFRSFSPVSQPARRGKQAGTAKRAAAIRTPRRQPLLLRRELHGSKRLQSLLRCNPSRACSTRSRAATASRTNGAPATCGPPPSFDPAHCFAINTQTNIFSSKTIKTVVPPFFSI